MDTDIIIRKIKENKPIWVGVLLIVLIIIAIFWHIYAPQQGTKLTPGNISLTGKFACLPYSDNATNTAACMLGIKNGAKYYGLDASDIKQVVTDLKADETIAIEGTFIPRASTTDWKDYDIDGVIKASSLTRSK
jgi:hypothetical protein